MAVNERFRNKRITLRLTEEEKKLLFDKAELCNMNANCFLRNAIFKTSITVNKIPVEEIRNAQNAMDENAYAINRIGNNINQIVKIIHENNDTYSKSQIQEIMNDLENVLRKYEKLCGVMFDKLYGLV